MKKYRVPRKHRAAAGFTLVEVMIVLFILMTLASVGILAYGQMAERGRIQIAKIYVSNMKDKLALFKVDVGHFPTTEEKLDALVSCPGTCNPEKWGGPYIDEDGVKEDPWGNVYDYESDGAKCRTWSYGPDGASGTEDDIISISGN